MPDPTSVGLPVKPFLYTLDQIASLLSLTIETLHRGGYLYYDGTSTGSHKLDLIKAIDISPNSSVNEWRVSESELIRWMKRKGFRVYLRGYAR